MLIFVKLIESLPGFRLAKWGERWYTKLKKMETFFSPVFGYGTGNRRTE